MNSKHSSGLKRKASDKLETVSMDEFLRRLGPGGRRDWANKTRGTIDLFEAYESKNPAETTRDNTQLGGKKPWQKELNYSFANSDSGNAKAEGTSNTKSSQDMDNIRKVGRLMERVEALEAENREMIENNSQLNQVVDMLLGCIIWSLLARCMPLMVCWHERFTRSRPRKINIVSSHRRDGQSFKFEWFFE